MVRSIRTFIRKRQTGAAAVELAVLLPILIISMTVPLFFGRFYWHYTVAHRAAQDAARYLATISEREMRTGVLSQAAGAVATGIAEEELAELNPGPEAPGITVFCGPTRLCSGPALGWTAPLPNIVRVTVELKMVDNIFGAVYTGWDGWPITAQVEMRYVGK